MKIIDISQHNGYIDFGKVKNDGVEGIIIRVGWIGNKQNHTLDTYFEDYYKKAIEWGFKIGFYVYSYCKNQNAILSGTNWLKSKTSNKKCDLGCFLDLEDETILYLDREELTRHAEIFCSNIENSGVYASEFWFKNKLYIDRIKQYKIWLAKWTNKRPEENFKYDIWQYSSEGNIEGISTKVDLNECINCEDQEQNSNINNGGFEMKKYKNGSTKELVYQDLNCTKQIGYLNEYEECECYGIINNGIYARPLVVYNIDNTNNKKVGFVKWMGGVK